MKYKLSILAGVTLCQTALWLGAYLTYSIPENSWMQVPILLTAVSISVTGGGLIMRGLTKGTFFN